jgi:hypothetical protein
MTDALSPVDRDALECCITWGVGCCGAPGAPYIRALEQRGLVKVFSTAPDGEGLNYDITPAGREAIGLAA